MAEIHTLPEREGLTFRPIGGVLGEVLLNAKLAQGRRRLEEKVLLEGYAEFGLGWLLSETEPVSEHDDEDRP